MEASNANEARIQQLFFEGHTTKEAIRPHVSCADDTITRCLSRIKKDLRETTSFSVKGFSLSDSYKEMQSHADSLRDDLDTIKNEMDCTPCEESRWMALGKQKVMLMKEIQRLSGAEVVLEFQRDQAQRSLKAQEQVVLERQKKVETPAVSHKMPDW